jgi:hypothetical protein
MHVLNNSVLIKLNMTIIKHKDSHTQDRKEMAMMYFTIRMFTLKD